jgi:hypothetical protein
LVSGISCRQWLQIIVSFSDRNWLQHKQACGKNRLNRELIIGMAFKWKLALTEKDL